VGVYHSLQQAIGELSGAGRVRSQDEPEHAVLLSGLLPRALARGDMARGYPPDDGGGCWCGSIMRLRVEQDRAGRGAIRLGWLERIIELLHANEIGVLLCTPTASPPIWIVDKIPDVLVRDVNRTVRPVGGRRHYCYNHPIYRQMSAGIAGAMARKFGSHPAVIGWQIDNEFGQENTGRCYCEICADKFREWLQERYDSLDDLNSRWGTGSWSQSYTDWKQIEPPTQGVLSEAPSLQPMLKQNPAWLLEFERFCSDSTVDYQQLQIDAIRRYSDRPITHNTTGLATNKVNYFDLARNLDRIGIDVYPAGDAEDFSEASAAYSFARGIKTDTPFWVMELLSGGGHALWNGEGLPQLYPGTLRMLIWQAFASGAEKVFHFQWRAFARGAEQLDPAIIDLDGVPRRRYHEIKDTAFEINSLSAVLAGTKVRSQVGIMWCYDHHWSLAIKPISRELSYPSALLRHCAELKVSTRMVLGIG